MKKLLLISFLLFCATFCFAQFPISQSTGNSNTQVYSRGGQGADSGFIWRTNFADTGAANKGFLKNVPGIVIRTGSTLWLRNQATTSWVLIGQRFGQPGEDVIANVDRSFDLDGNDFTFEGGKYQFNTSASNTLSIGSSGGVETGVLYTTDGTVLRLETRNSAGMSIVAGSQISMQAAASSGQLVFNGMTSNYLTQDWYTGGGGLIGQQGISVYNALNDESQFFFKALDSDTTITYLTLYDKMKFIDIPNDNTITKIIGLDADDNVRYIDASAIGGGSDSLFGVGDNLFIANRAVNQSTFNINLTGAGFFQLGTAIGSSTGRLQVQNPTAGGQNAAFGPLLSNNVYLSNYAIDSVTAATVGSIKSTGIYTRRKIVVNSGSFSRGGLWNMASDLMFETRDSIRLDPVGSDLLAGIIARILMQPAGTGRSIVQNGTFKDDYVAAIVAAIQNDNTNTSNWILNRGYKASLVAHFINGGTKDTTENYAGVFSTALNSGRILRANQFYAGPIGNVDSLFAFYAPYESFNYFKTGLRLGGDVAGNSYVQDASAILHVSSTTKGVLIPSMTQAQESAISSPASFLMLVNTDSSRMRVRVGSAYQSVAFLTDIPAASGSGTVTNVATGYGLSGGPITTTGTLLFDSATVFTQLRSEMWTVGGNTGVAGSITGSWIGTLNSVSWRMRTANTERMVLDSGRAQLRIGSPTANITDGLIIQAPGNGNYDGIKVYAQGGVTPLTIGQAGFTRGGGYDFNTSSGSISFSPTGGVFFGTAFTAATAHVHMAAGSTSKPPMRFTSGPLTTGGNILAGNFEFLTDKWYATITTGPAQKEVALNDIALTSGRVPFVTTNGRLTDAAELQFTGTSLGVGGSPGSANLLVTGTAATLTGIRVLSTIVAVAGAEAYGIYANPSMTEAGSGTHAMFATMRLQGPTVTGGVATLTRTAAIYLSDNSSATVTDANYAIYSLLTGPSVLNGHLTLGTAGNKLSITTGSNASVGVSGAMTAGSITISTTAVAASSLIFLTHATVSGTQGILSVGTITAGTSFVINSSSALDVSTVNWWIIN